MTGLLCIFGINPRASQGYCTARQCWRIGKNFGKCSIFSPTFIGFGIHLVIGQFRKFSCFSSAFHWSQSIGKPRITPVSLLNYGIIQVTSVIINRKTSYDSSILRQTRFSTKSYEIFRLSYLYRNGPKRTGLITASDQTVRAVHTYS